MNKSLPEWLNNALQKNTPELRKAFKLFSTEDAGKLETLAQQAQSLTQRRFGRTISLYAPLYLSNYCSGGCVYCGFASDRNTSRRKLSKNEIEKELRALKTMGINDVLLLTGERTNEAGLDYLTEAVSTAAQLFDQVSIEAFPMETNEYRRLVEAGCSGVTVYQETYNPVQYEKMHRWGPKKDFRGRLDTPLRAMRAGMRTVGIGALLGLSDPAQEALCLLSHANDLLKNSRQCAISVSFPRLRPQTGGFQAPYPVTDRRLTAIICAFRLCLPDIALVLSTRESPLFRDAMAGIGISKMSVASRTTVGGYHTTNKQEAGQFKVCDERDIETVCNALRSRKLDPVFKNWDRVFR